MTGSGSGIVRRTLIALFALVLMTVVGAALLEGAARLAYRLGRYHPKVLTEAYLQSNPYLYQILKPGSHTQLRTASVDVNSLGFRGPEFSARKPDGVFRVFVLGGSTTFGYPESIPTTQDTYPFKLQEALQRRFGRSRVEVINAGVTGYSLRTNVVNYATRLTWYQPDLIIVYHAVNDLIITRDETDLFESVVKADAGPGLWEQVRNSSYLLLELNFRLYKFFVHPAFSAGGDAPKAVPPPAALAAYERHLRHLVEMATADGVQVVIGNESTWIPEVCDDPGRSGSLDEITARACFGLRWYFPHLTTEGVRRSFSAMADIQQRVARDHGLRWVDMNPIVPGSPEYYWDFCHTRPAATTLIADEFARQVSPLIERALPAPAVAAVAPPAAPKETQ